MLRIHFTAQDLAYVRLARSPDPLWEIVCSLCRLQTDEGPLAFGPWRRAVAARLRGPGGAGGGGGGGGTDRAVALALRSLVPCGPYIPDFLTPAVDGGTVDLRQGVDRVLSTPRSRLRRELTLLTESVRTGVRGPGARVRPFAGEPLARGDAGALRALGGLLTAQHQPAAGDPARGGPHRLPQGGPVRAAPPDAARAAAAGDGGGGWVLADRSGGGG
ncbi:hypothetical protein [Streptomyces sp. NPDC057552]|uniref:hypothetical protein n=1 Tax=Streptomyces sp. NPDC057552 TaxID=3350537 RepID=UPI00368696BA